jgi:hypothetical protein
MKLIINVTLLWVCNLAAYAASPVWHTGHVMLLSGEKIEGKLYYNWKAEVLQVRMPDDTRRAFSAQRVDSFCFFDSEQNTLRTFSTVEMPTSAGLVRPVFLETYALGHFTVYRRLRHSKEFIRMPRMTLNTSNDEWDKDLDNFQYYIVDPVGIVTDLQDFDQVLWPQMRSEFSAELAHLQRERQLDVASTVGQLILINQYNYLRDKLPTQANKPATEVAGQ